MCKQSYVRRRSPSPGLRSPVDLSYLHALQALQQAQLKPHAAGGGGGGSKRQKAGGGAKLPGSSGLRIEHFFDRAT